MQGTKKVELSSNTVLFELRVSTLKGIGLAQLHTALEIFAARTRSLKMWTLITYVCADGERAGEAVVMLLAVRKEALHRLDNAFLGFKRGLAKLLPGADIQRRSWARVHGSSTLVYADIHAFEDEGFEAVRQRLVEQAKHEASLGAPPLVSSPLAPLPAAALAAAGTWRGTP